MNGSGFDVEKETNKLSLSFLLCGTLGFFFAVIMNTFVTIAAERIGLRVRTLYVRAVLHKDLSWQVVCNNFHLPHYLAALNV